MNKQESTRKPNLYKGEQLPLGSLSPKQFENFVYGTFSEIGKNHNFDVTNTGPKGTDDGFDVTARRITDQGLICIQCKRYTSTLYESTISSELAKVAINSFLEKSTIKEHFFITTGDVSKKLRSAERETTRSKLANNALNALKTDDFKSLLKKCKNEKVDVNKVVSDYIENLEKIIIWSANDFDLELGKVWSKISDALENYFSLDVLIKEYPRPNFNRDDYYKTFIDASSFTELLATPTNLPNNLVTYDSSNPLSRTLNSNISTQIVGSEDVFDLLDFLITTPLGRARVITGAGGAGKSTTLLKVADHLAKHKEYTNTTPVFLRLSKYNGNIDLLINDSLNIKYGNWSSIPTNFLFLCDGLDEISTQLAQEFLTDLSKTLKASNCSSLITLRKNGPRSQLFLPEIQLCLELQPLTYRQCFEIAKEVFKESEYLGFLNEFRKKVSSLGNEMFSLPYGYTAAIDSFLENGSLPNTPEELLEDVYTRRIKYNKTRVKNLPKEIQELSDTTIRTFAEIISFEFRIDRQATYLKNIEVESIIQKVLSILKDRKIFGADSLNDNLLKTVATHFEVLQTKNDGVVTCGHDILSDYLASFELSSCWKKHLHHLKSTIAQESWVYASPRIKEEDQVEFLKSLLSEDLILGTMATQKSSENLWYLAEENIFEEFAKSTRLRKGRAIYAMSLLASTNCINELKKFQSSKDRDNQYMGKRGLVKLGYRDVIKHCLEDNEGMASYGGFTVTGGTINLWKDASPFHRVSIARERIEESINSGNEYIVLSLNTIEVFGDFTDMNNLIHIITKSENLPTFYAACQAGYNIDRELTVKILNKLAKSPKNMPLLYIYEVLDAFDEKLDLKPLVKIFLEIYDFDIKKDLSGMDRLVTLLSTHDLAEGTGKLLYKTYKKASHEQRQNIWKVATAQSFIEFEKVAIEQIENYTIGQLCFAIEFIEKNISISSNEITNKLKDLCKRLSQDIGKTWADHRSILEYLHKINENDFVASELDQVFTKYTTLHVQARSYKRSLSLKERQAIRDPEIGFFVEMHLCFYLPLLEKCLPLLNDELKELIIPLDVRCTSDDVKKSHSAIITTLPSSMLDNGIEKVADPYDCFSIIGRISDYSLTERRKIKLFKLLPLIIDHHMIYGDLIKIIRNHPSEDLFKNIIYAVVNANWVHYSSAQMFDDVEQILGNLIDKDFSDQIITPLLQKKLHPVAKDILQYIKDYVDTKR